MVRALLDTLADQLQAVSVQASAGASQLPDWKPVVADCHGNADRWAAAHLGDTALRGWLRERFADLPHRFVAHSLVRTAASALVEAMLPAALEPLRFFEIYRVRLLYINFFLCPLRFPVRAAAVAGIDEFLSVPPDNSPVKEAGAETRAAGFPENIA